jgi:hypothetical protein
MENALKEFGRRYYRWCLATGQRQAESGFQRLSHMRTDSVLRYLKLIEASPPATRSGIVNAFIRRRLLVEFLADEIDGDTLSDWERELVESHFAHPRPRLPEDLRFEELEQSSPHLFRIDRREVVQALKEAVQSAGFILQKFDSGSNWYSVCEIGIWQLRTDFQFGGRSSQFCYWHRITGPNHYMLRGTISIVSSLGITGGAATWIRCNTNELKIGIEHAVMASVEFLQAAPSLLCDLPGD